MTARCVPEGRTARFQSDFHHKTCVRAMSKFSEISGLLAIAVCVFNACGGASDSGVPRSPNASSDTATAVREYEGAAEAPVRLSASEGLFAEAEQQLIVGNYRMAASQLNEGIVAFRFETGRVHGNAAIEINHSIDTLTRLRSRLRKRQDVSAGDLHRAVANALVLLPGTWRLSGRFAAPAGDSQQENTRTIAVPVNEGN